MTVRYMLTIGLSKDVPRHLSDSACGCACSLAIAVAKEFRHLVVPSPSPYSSHLSVRAQTKRSLLTSEPDRDAANPEPASRESKRDEQTGNQSHGVTPSLRRFSTRRHDRYCNIGRRLQCVQQQGSVRSRHQRVRTVWAVPRVWEQQQRHRTFAGDILWHSKCCA